MKKNKKSISIINQIQNIRTKNNKNWMNLLKLAFKRDPKSASKILSKITNLFFHAFPVLQYLRLQLDGHQDV